MTRGDGGECKQRVPGVPFVPWDAWLTRGFLLRRGAAAAGVGGGVAADPQNWVEGQTSSRIRVAVGSDPSGANSMFAGGFADSIGFGCDGLQRVLMVGVTD